MTKIIFMSHLFVIGIFLSYFLFLMLIRKKQKNTSDYLLAGLFFIIGTHLLDYYFYLSGYWLQHPHFIAVGAGIPFLYGPLFYLYIKLSLRNDKKLKWRDTLHLIPYVAYYLAISPFYFYEAAEKVRVLNEDLDDFSLVNQMATIVICIVGIGYPYKSSRLLSRTHSLIRNNFSYQEEINHLWLKYSIWGGFVIFIIVIGVVILQNFFMVKARFQLDLIFYIPMIFYVLFLGYYGIRHRGIFTETQHPVITEDNFEEAYKKSGLKKEEAALIHQKLSKYMELEKPWLKPRLTLSELAFSLDVPLHHLSQCINQYETKNFYDFVNQYRLDEFKKRVNDPRFEHFNLLAIALDSGFNSKSSFNLVFKKSEGITPSEFMKKKPPPSSHLTS
jgi:AraC-like DNA-binding protein